MNKRDDANGQPTLADRIQAEQSTDPVGAAKLVQQIPYLANNPHAFSITSAN